MSIDYSTAGPLTDLSALPAGALRCLPADPLDLCRVTAGLLVHEALAAALGWTPPAERRPEIQIRNAASIVACALSHCSAPLTDARPLDQRVLSTCRDFAVVAAALLRHQGIPARARCGFGTCFEAGKHIDHWIVEYRDGDRWRRVDPELCDDAARRLTGAQVDPFDLDPGAFVTGGAAWLGCREGRIDPASCGIYDLWGLSFVRGNAVRDLAALAKVELLPWDGWGVLEEPFDDNDRAALELIDDVARTAESGDVDAIDRLYHDARLRVPGRVRAWAEGGGALVEVPELV